LLQRLITELQENNARNEETIRTKLEKDEKEEKDEEEKEIKRRNSIDDLSKANEMLKNENLSQMKEQLEKQIEEKIKNADANDRLRKDLEVIIAEREALEEQVRV
jgi:uncharacterized protein YcbK (DUF882 family)